MNKKIIYAIGVFGLVLLGWYVSGMSEPMVVVNTPLQDEEELIVSSSTTRSVTSKKVTTQKASAPSKGEYVVTYTEDGFEPSEFQIPRGASVKFVNKTNTSMRIFADNDAKPPFSDLNQPKALGQNGEYVFNFVYSGIWKYYNSSHPEDTANIVVY
jgi:plastocyanin